MIEVGIILLFSTTALLIFIETKAIKKGRRINDTISFLLAKKPENSAEKENNSEKASWQIKVHKRTIIESSVVAVGASGLNIYDIYSAIDDHKEVLNVLEDRFPNELEGATSMDWFSKTMELGPEGIQGYISNYAGQAAENQAVDYFRNSGKEAELFESRTHPGNDIRVPNEDGTFTNY